MKEMRFYGNEICCGSYACLNAMKNKEIDLQMFEISTGAPFGICHMENQRFDRILTTCFDPNKGMDTALEMWGYGVEKYVCCTSGEVIAILKRKLKKYPAVVGPINMGKLSYQIMPHLLERMDHYIMLEYWSEDEVLCTDSEGFCDFCVRYEELKTYISAEEVAEAEGVICVRFIYPEREFFLKDIIESSYFNAFRNLCKAERMNEGSKAILRSFAFLSQHDMNEWRLPFLFDIQYLQQRKYLMSLLLEKYKEIGGRIQENLCETIGQQQRILGEMYHKLKYDMCIKEEYFQVMAELEYKLPFVLDVGR